MPDPTFLVVRGSLEGLDMIIPASAGRDSTLERRIWDRRRLVFSEYFLRRPFACGSGAYIDIGANVGLVGNEHFVQALASG